MLVQIAAIAVAAVAGIAWLWRRSINKQADALTRVADGIVFLRKSAGVTPRMVPVARTDERDAQLAETSGEIEAAGFRMLGDVEEYNRDGTSAGIARWIVSADGHVCGWFAMTPGGPVLLLVSEDAGRAFATTIRSAPAPGVSVPDTIRRTDVDLDESLTTAIGIHRAEVSAFGQLVAVHDLDEAFACMRRMSAHIGAWRSGQEPRGLLESDVRNIAGEHYASVGESLIQLVNLTEMKAEWAK
jgi:hypothetical protein